jgi:hypothetical protein
LFNPVCFGCRVFFLLEKGAEKNDAHLRINFLVIVIPAHAGQKREAR